MLTAIILAVLASLLWGITNHIDKYLISKIIKNGSFKGLMIFSSLVIGSLLAPIYLIINNFNINLDYTSLLMIFLAATLNLLAVGTYFKALTKNDTSIVIAMFQLIPVFGYFLGLIFLDEILTLKQILGGIIIIISSIALTYEFEKNKFSKGKLIALLLISISSLSYAVYHLIFKVASIGNEFNIIIFWYQIGLIVNGLLLVGLFKSFRRDFIKLVIENGKNVFMLNILNETIYLGAEIIFNYATVIAPLALVLTLNGFQPFFVFLIGAIGTMLFPRTFNEDLSKKVVIQKIVCISFSIIGLAIIYI